jgi:hypothetical protein
MGTFPEEEGYRCRQVSSIWTNSKILIENPWMSKPAGKI